MPPKRTVKKSLRFWKKRFNKRRGTKSLVKLIKKVSLRQAETKNTHTIIENNDMYHNSEYIQSNFLQTQQGVGDTNSGTSAYSMRIGDKVVARGLSIKVWLATKSDRPNVMFRIAVFKYGNPLYVPGTAYASQSGANIMIRDYDNEKVKIVKSKIVNCQVGFSQSIASSSIWSGREAHKLVKFWIPLKNKQISYYTDNSAVPSFSDYGISISAYDSYGTLTTDKIASYAINYKFYFKDP